MCKETRFTRSTRALWREGYEAYERWPADWRALLAPAVGGLLTALRRCSGECELRRCYWEPGDWPASVLRRCLPVALGSEALLALEDACFWLRLRELVDG